MVGSSVLTPPWMNITIIVEMIPGAIAPSVFVEALYIVSQSVVHLRIMRISMNPKRAQRRTT